jgi:hypothetical protein
MIIIKALLLEGLKAYLTTRKTKHAITAVVRGHCWLLYWPAQKSSISLMALVK